MTFPLTILFMFLVFWRPQEWLLPWMYGWPVLDAITYVALLSLLIEVNQGAARFPKTPAMLLAAGLWMATALSHLPHTYFQGIVNTIPETFKFCFFLVLLIVVIDRVSRLRFLFVVFMVGALLMATHCLLQERRGYGFAGAYPMWQYRPIEDIWVSRSYFFGIFADPNDTAQFFAAAIPLVFAVPRRLNGIALIGSGAVAVVLTWALLTTHSRGGQLALIATGLCILLLVLPTRWLPYIAIAGLLAGLVMCRFFGGKMLDASSQERVVFWGLANREFKANPFFGLGYGMFWQVAGDRAAHNAFVSCYTEVGLVGYWFWFNLIQVGIIGAWRSRLALSRARTPVQVYLRRAAGLTIAALVGFCAGAYFLSRAFVFPIFFLIAIANAVPVLAQKLLPEDHPPLVNVRRDVYGVGSLSALFSVAYIYCTILLLNAMYY